MKKPSLLLTGVASLLLLAFATPTFAAEKGKQKTIVGEAKCTKCALHETDKCQTVIDVEGKNGKKHVMYYLVDNDKAKEFHENICKGPKKVKAVGTVKKVDGKNELEVTKIEVVKEP